MAFTLDTFVPLGRSLEEYRRMFAMTDLDCRRRILGCADGPASFNAELAAADGSVVSCDPLYDFSADEIRQQIQRTLPDIIEQTQQNADTFVWSTEIPDVDALAARRMAAMDRFLMTTKSGAGKTDTSRRDCLNFRLLTTRSTLWSARISSFYTAIICPRNSMGMHQVAHGLTIVRSFPSPEAAGGNATRREQPIAMVRASGKTRQQVGSHSPCSGPDGRRPWSWLGLMVWLGIRRVQKSPAATLHHSATFLILANGMLRSV